MRAWLIKPAGNVELYVFATMPSRETIRSMVLGDLDGMVEHVTVHWQQQCGQGPVPSSMYVDEMGLARDDPPTINPFASLLYQQASLWSGRLAQAKTCAIAGTALVLEVHERHSVSSEQRGLDL